jgi:hypothetical protein
VQVRPYAGSILGGLNPVQVRLYAGSILGGLNPVQVRPYDGSILGGLNAVQVRLYACCTGCRLCAMSFDRTVNNVDLFEAHFQHLKPVVKLHYIIIIH